LLHIHPLFAIFIWPLFGVAVLFYLPFWCDSALPPGIWFGSARGKILALWTSCVAVLITLGVILTDNLLLQLGSSAAGNSLLLRGLLPTSGVLVLSVCSYLLLVRKLKYSRAEVVMSGIVFLLSALAVSTIIGLWFRGAGMLLVWP